MLLLLMGSLTAQAADGPAADDNLNAVLWMQRSVEYKGATMSAFALARFRLDQALVDKNWMAAPAEQTSPSPEAQRTAKQSVLQPWAGPKS